MKLPISSHSQQHLLLSILFITTIQALWSDISFLIPISSAQFSCSVMSDSLWPHGLQHARPSCPSPTPRVYSNSSPLSQWCLPTISSRHSLLLPSIFPSIRVFSNESVLRTRWPKFWSFSFTSVLPMNIQDWFPLGWTGWISLQSKGLLRVFSNITVQAHQFFGAQLSLQSNYKEIIISFPFPAHFFIAIKNVPFK